LAVAVAVGVTQNKHMAVVAVVVKLLCEQEKLLQHNQ
jgi:hypothetical protein